MKMTPWVPVLLAVASGVIAAAVVRPRTVAAPKPPIPRVQGTLPEQLDATLQIVDARLAADPADAPAAIRAAEILLRKARIERRGGPALQAERILETLLDHEPGEYSALRMLGAAYLSQHKFHDAIAVATRGLAVKPRDAWQYGVLGDAYLELGDRIRAFEAFDTMMGLRPDAGSYARVAYALELQGDLAESLRVMTMATEATSPDDAEALAWQHAHLGNLYLKLGDQKAADREFRHALYVFPGYPDALDGLSKIDPAGARP